MSHLGNGNGRGISHATLLAGLLGICGTVALGVVSWVLMTLVDVRDRVHKLEVTRPFWEKRFNVMESDIRMLIGDVEPHLARPPGGRDDEHGGAN